MTFRKLNELCHNINESTKALLTSREKIDSVKKDVLNVVETLLDEQVSEETLITSSKMLSQSDYSDVVEERNILGICGYPLCAKDIKISSQKYRISCKAKKVYDITERKCFCSNECFKASKFLKLQLSPEPMWLQTEPVNVELLKDESSSGGLGEEVLFQNGIAELDPIIDNNQTNGLESLLLEEISECASKFEDLVLKENEQDYIKLNKEESINQQSQNQTNNHQSSSESEGIDSDESFDLEHNTYQKSQSLPEKGNTNDVFPLRKSKYGPAMLIEPLPMKVATPLKHLKCGIPLPNIFRILKEWITLQSLELLLGKDHVQSIQSRSFEDFIAEESLDDGLSKFQLGFEKLCLSIDTFEKEDEEMDVALLKDSAEIDSQPTKISIEENITEKESETLTSCQIKPTAVDQVIKKQTRKKVDKKSSQKKGKKTVRFSLDTKDEKDEANGNVREPLFPLIESLSRGAVQQQIVSEKLKIAFGHLLPLVRLCHRSISADLRTLLATFSFSPNNISYSPSGWKSIALVLLRLLEKMSSNCDNATFCELLSKTQIEIGSLEDIDKLITDLINVETFLKG